MSISSRDSVPFTQQESKLILTELSPVGSSSSSASSQQQVSSQQGSPQDSSSLFQDLNNRNLLQQQSIHNNIHQPPKYVYPQNAPPYGFSPCNDYYRSQQQQRVNNQQQNADFTKVPPYTSQNHHSLYEQIGPNVTCATSENDLDSLRAQVGMNGHRSNHVQRQFNFASYLNTDMPPHQNWMRTDLTSSQQIGFPNNLSTSSNMSFPVTNPQAFPQQNTAQFNWN